MVLWYLMVYMLIYTIYLCAIVVFLKLFHTVFNAYSGKHSF